jgi:hypothetical protein
MVTTKKCAWGTCKSDSRYLDWLKRNNNGANILFYIFLWLDTIAQNESAGYVHTTEAIHLYVRRIDIYVAFILLDKMVLLKNIQTLYQQ